MFNKTDTACCQIKMGTVAYLSGGHHMFNQTDTTCNMSMWVCYTEYTYNTSFFSFTIEVTKIVYPTYVLCLWKQILSILGQHSISPFLWADQILDLTTAVPALPAVKRLASAYCLSESSVRHSGMVGRSSTSPTRWGKYQLDDDDRDLINKYDIRTKAHTQRLIR